jgi:hypothetical protein
MPHRHQRHTRTQTAHTHLVSDAPAPPSNTSKAVNHPVGARLAVGLSASLPQRLASKAWILDDLSTTRNAKAMIAVPSNHCVSIKVARSTHEVHVRSSSE